MNIYSLKTPLNNIEMLRTGDKVLLSGKLLTARDQAHRRIADLINKRTKLPIDLNNTGIYYTGPIIDLKTGLFTSAGPTTSARMDKYTSMMLQAGVKFFIGKGNRNEETTKLIAGHKALYFSTIGGAGALLAKCIVSTKIIAFPDLGTEAVYEIEVIDFPCYVAIDSHGNNIFDYNKQINI